MQDAGVGIQGQELVFGILAREGIGRLSEVVGAEGEELRQLCQVGRAGTGPYRLDHAAEPEAQRDAVACLDLGAHLVGAGADALELLHRDDLRHHDFRTYGNPGPEAAGLGLQDGADLHLVDFRVGDAETDTTMPEHRVDLVQVADLLQHQFLAGDDAVDEVLVDAGIGFLGQVQRVDGGQGGGAALDHQPVFPEGLDLVQQLRFAGQELVHGRVKQPYRDRVRRDDAEHFLEILALHRQQLVQGGLALLQGAGHDHLDHHRQPLAGVEHALRAAQADAPGAVLDGHPGHLGGVAVGHDLEPGLFVGPAEQGVQFVRELRRQGRNLAQIDVAVGAVDGDDVALAQDDVADPGQPRPAVDGDALGAGDAGLAHAAGDHGGVRGLAAAAGQDALGGEEAVDVLRLGLLAYQDHLLAGTAEHLGLVGVEHAAAAGGAGRGRQALGQRRLAVVRVEARMQELLQQGGIDPQQRLVLADQPLGVHFDRGAHHGGGVHLAVAGLQAVEHAFLDGVLVVLHLAVMRFQLVAQFDQLVVHLRHFVRHLGHRLGRADTGDDVLALGIDQVLAVHLVLAGAGIAGEADAGGAVVAHVAEHHGDDVDRRAVGHLRGDVELAPIVHRALARPGIEDRLDGQLELLVGVLRERAPGLFLHHLQEQLADLAQVGGAQAHVDLDAGAALDGLEMLVETVLVDAQRDLAEQLDEAAVGVVAEALVAGQADQSLQGGLVEAQVEDGIHHAGHGQGRARAHRDQQRIAVPAELLAGLLLQQLDVAQHLLHQLLRQDFPLQIFEAGLRGDDETRRYVQANLGHLAEIGALAAEEPLVLAVSLAECVNVSLVHDGSLVRRSGWRLVR